MTQKQVRYSLLVSLLIWLTFTGCSSKKTSPTINPSPTTVIPSIEPTYTPLAPSIKPTPPPSATLAPPPPTRTPYPSNTPRPTIVFPVLTGDYLGQEPPGIKAMLFTPGIISTDMNERDITFTPDGKELYYTMHGEGFFVILYMKQENGVWTPPQVAPFSGQFSDLEASITPDGQRIFFTSNRPRFEGDTSTDQDLWFAERSGDGWSVPQNLGDTINSSASEYYPSLTTEGTLYFTASYPGGKGGSDLYRSSLVGGQYQTPENLGDLINSSQDEYNSYIAPDESYMIFGRSGLTWITFRQPDGSWTRPRSMDNEIGLTDVGWSPYVSYDGKYLFISNIAPPGIDLAPYPPSYDEIRKAILDPDNVIKLDKKHFSHENIYWISSQVIENFR
jgi:WD40-like Beta Propeller Repeat